MTTKLKVKHFVTPEQVREDTTFTESGLNEAMLEQSSLMAYYGSLCGEAQYQVDKFKQLLDIAEAKLARDIRDEVGFFQTVRAALAKSTPGKGRTSAERDLAVQQIVVERLKGAQN